MALIAEEVSDSRTLQSQSRVATNDNANCIMTELQLQKRSRSSEGAGPRKVPPLPLDRLRTAQFGFEPAPLPACVVQ